VKAGRSVRAQAPAKINRELRVGPRRPDGYHDIRSRFVTIDLADEIEAREAPQFQLSGGAPGLPMDGSNLVARAAFALAHSLGVEPRVHLQLSKRIPVGAGLGGGSSDAAATLRLLCRLWGRTVPEAQLRALAAELGSDVAFFLAGGEADVAGRGERVAPQEDAPPRDLTLLVPPFSISTAAAYAAFDRLGKASPPPERLEIEASGRFLGPNDLESAAAVVAPELQTYLEHARQIAAECAVTGSGSAIVLVGAPAERVSEILRRHPGAHALGARTIGREEFLRRTAAADDPAPRA
jgi:4-diphosphocytidyl-2-C-methyl-D-erythritol kinase